MGQVWYDGTAALSSAAGRLPGAPGLPALFAFTDPKRTPDPLALAASLPPGAGIVLRTFGHGSIEAAAFALAGLCRARGLTLLIAADPDLAARCGADGVHWPERLIARARRPWRGAIQTAAAHGPDALRRAQSRVDAIFVSPVFASNSPSAGRPIGVFRAAACARRARVPVYALGGVTARTIRRLQGTGIAGAAAVEGWTRSA